MTQKDCLPGRLHALLRGAVLMLAAAWAHGAHAAQASQEASFTLPAATVLNAAVFRFGTQPPVDGFTPAQTGLASSASLETNGGVRALLTGNGLAQVQVRYDPAWLSPGPSNGVLAGYFGTGSDLSIVLPAGTSGTPLSFAKPATTPGFFGVVDNGNLGPNIALFTQGSTDALLFGLATGSFTNSSLTLVNAPGLVSKVNLLADPQFVATYNGAVPLPNLPSLTVTLQHGTSVQLNDPSFQLVDLSGTALTGLGLPASIAIDAFDRRSVLLPFDGTLTLSLSAADFASAGDFATAQAWVQSSGLQSQVLLRQVAVWEVSAVPEPAAWGLMLGGVGVLLWVVRVRRGRAQSRKIRLQHLAGASMAIALIPPAAALDFVWISNCNGNYASQNCWTPVGVPGEDDHIFISAGTVFVPSPQVVGSLTQSGGTLVGSDLTVRSPSTFSGGTHQGPGATRFEDHLDLFGNTRKSVLQNRTVYTDGVTDWQGNTAVNGNELVFGGGASGTWVNAGIWNDRNTFDTRMAADNSTGTNFRNTGTYNKIGASATSVTVPFQNTGTLSIQAGTVGFGGGGRSEPGSVIHIASGAVFSIGAGQQPTAEWLIDRANLQGTGTILLRNGSASGGTTLRIAGDHVFGGTLDIRQGILDVADDVSVHTVVQSGGTVAGAGHFSTDQPALWTAGTHSGTGSSRFSGDLQLAGNGRKSVVNGRTVYTAGVTEWNGNTVANGNDIVFGAGGNGTWINTGTWDDRNPFSTRLAADNSLGSSFRNEGTYNKVGASTTSVSVAFHNTGTLNVGAGAVLRVTNPNFTSTGRVEGHGTIGTATGGALTSSGVIGPGSSTGLLTIEGTLLMQAGSSFEVELSSLSDFDQLDIDGTVRLDGVLQVLNLGYSPVVGDEFVVLAFDQRVSGSSFSGLTWSGFGPDVGFEIAYNLNDVTLRVVAVPEPGTWLLWFTGLLAMSPLLMRLRK